MNRKQRKPNSPPCRKALGVSVFRFCVPLHSEIKVHDRMGLAGFEPATSPLSGARSNQLSYKPVRRIAFHFHPNTFSAKPIIWRARYPTKFHTNVNAFPKLLRFFLPHNENPTPLQENQQQCTRHNPLQNNRLAKRHRTSLPRKEPVAKNRIRGGIGCATEKSLARRGAGSQVRSQGSGVADRCDVPTGFAWAHRAESWDRVSTLAPSS